MVDKPQEIKNRKIPAETILGGNLNLLFKIYVQTAHNNKAKLPNTLIRVTLGISDISCNLRKIGCAIGTKKTIKSKKAKTNNLK
jgi:hypothetical protein